MLMEPVRRSTHSNVCVSRWNWTVFVNRSIHHACMQMLDWSRTVVRIKNDFCRAMLTVSLYFIGNDLAWLRNFCFFLVTRLESSLRTLAHMHVMRTFVRLYRDYSENVLYVFAYAGGLYILILQIQLCLSYTKWLLIKENTNNKASHIQQ